ncbi:MAG: hydrolase [Phycisphaerales bacterium]|nr:hydrolase [Phycisphaerales bacterium]
MADVLGKLRPETAALLVIDVQDRLLPAISEAEQRVEYIRRMIEAAKVLQVPILATEQYPAGLGRTCETIQSCLEGITYIEKMSFSACEQRLIDRLAELDRSQIIVVGIEAHVCVQQTTLDLLRMGYAVYVCTDAVGSRRTLDAAVAFERMRQAGAIVTTTESVTFELLGRAGTEAFKKILPIVK